MSAPLIQIGASPIAIKEARQAINDILRVPHIDNKTRIEALKALSTVCQVNGSTITNCNLQGK